MVLTTNVMTTDRNIQEAHKTSYITTEKINTYKKLKLKPT